MTIRVFGIVLLTCLVAPNWAAAETLSAQQERGRVLAFGMCIGCHAVDRISDSPHRAAPRFRVLDQQTNLDKLAERLRGGIITGHEDMPMFRFNRDDADALVAYIRLIQAP